MGGCPDSGRHRGNAVWASEDSFPVQLPEGYQAMDERRAIKTLLMP